MKKILYSFLKSNDLLEIYNDIYNPNTFAVGTILNLSDEFVVVKLISKSGEYDGITVIKVSEIFCVETKTQYLNSLRLHDTSEIGCDTIKLAFTEKNYIECVLKFALATTKVVSVRFINSSCVDIVGIVQSCDESLCMIKCYAENGHANGESYFSIDSIAQVCMDSSDEKRIEKFI